MENPFKMDDLGVPLFSETAISLPSQHFCVDDIPAFQKVGFFRCHGVRPFGSGLHNPILRGQKLAIGY